MSRYTKNNEWLTPSAPPKRIAVGPVLRFARELAPARWRLGVAAALSLLFSASAAFIPLLFRTVERSIRAGEADAVALALLGYFAVMATQQGVGHLVNRVQASVYTELSERALLSYYETVLNVRVPQFLHMRRTTSLFQRVIDVMNVTRTFTTVVVQGTLNVITLVVLAVVMATIGWPILVALLIGGGTMAAYVLATTGRLRELHSQALATGYPLVSRMLEIINGMLTVKALTASVGVTADVQRLVERRRKAQYREDVYESRLGAVLGILRTATVVGALAVSFVMLGAGRLSIADLFSAYIIAGLLLNPVQGLARQYRQLATVSEDLIKYFEVIDMEVETTTPVSMGDGALLPAPVVDTPALGAPRREPGRVQLDGVTFGYREDTPILKDLHLDIRPGERVALIGKSGAGKTTLFRLLIGFLQPSAGQVRVGGEDPALVDDLNAYRRRIGVVSQSDFLFDVSIRDNLCIGTRSRSEAELKEVLTRVNMWDEVATLDKGLDEVFSDDTMSGGQRQRLLVARALVRDPELILLDEPTSALDFENEREVLRALDRLVEGRTSLIIAHRLSTVRSADRVIVMRDGRIVADGSHDVLYETDEYYRALCDFNSFIS
ncbi:hypothetical protein B1759_02455 [Rubrivirga sp. SAORIC476]|uniref:ABC transporter ATP-binding protein n=1 Tax=Rubrivirga sp. SAORIC476 TaxID=1961794 RepID=UPI000BA8F444|nr:ABC transporter ATP-binding protein [Rubrivirga sp. SAORIC476]PAP80281.1 hypothetical protein B1759_02455 [Rubrivirga sp. SAORIC476]